MRAAHTYILASCSQKLYYKNSSLTRGGKMINFVFHLNAYQPPTQPRDVVERIYKESYDPVLRFIEEYRHVFISLDIAKSLGERMPTEFLQRINSLYLAKRIALVNTAAYHYLLPLCPDEIVTRQVSLNLQFYRDHFVGTDDITGVFLPELAFSPRIITPLKIAGCKWMLADDYSFASQRLHQPTEFRVPQNWIPLMNGCGILLRSRFWSERIAQGNYVRGDSFARELIAEHKKWRETCLNWLDSYLILAVDFETFGHHHQKSIPQFLLPFFAELQGVDTDFRVVSLAAVFNRFPKIYDASMPDSSWSTSEENLKRGIPFTLWNHPENPFHQAWNDFMNTVFAVTPQNPVPELQELLDIAFYSCSPWQYSHGNKKVARWCLPLFQKIAEFLGHLSDSAKLKKNIEIMDKLTGGQD